MYGKNLVFKTGGVDGCDCAEILRLIAAGQIDYHTAYHTSFLVGGKLTKPTVFLRIGWEGGDKGGDCG